LINDIDNPEKYVSLFLGKAVDIISANYYGKLDYDRLFLGALSGMVNTLDEYSNVIPAYTQSEQTDYEKERPETVLSTLMRVGEYSIGVIKIFSFTEYTSNELRHVIEEYKEKEIKNVLIDLRDNQGGSVSSLISTSELLVGSQRLFYAKDKKGNITEYKTESEGAPFTKLAILVNKKTKSAAEMLAMVLQEGGALVCGEKTYGKSVSQTDFSVGGVTLRITTKEYYSYRRGSYNERGIKPDLYLPNMENLEEEKLLEKAIEQIFLNNV